MSPQMSVDPGLTFLRRFSSRLLPLDHVFLRDRLRNAATYDRIAGYFRSSIFEVAAEEIAQINRVRIVCNSDLDPDDLWTSQALRDQALVARWWDAGVSLPRMISAPAGEGQHRRPPKIVASSESLCAEIEQSSCNTLALNQAAGRP
jgi:hypothetical protein